VPKASARSLALAWIRESENEWILHLVDPCSELKGIHVAGTVPSGVQVSISAGELLTDQQIPLLTHSSDAGDFDIGLVALGPEQGIDGAGVLLRLATSSPCDLSEVFIEARDLANEPLSLEPTDSAGDETPRAYDLAQNYPNPFNPATTIAFDLPADEAVALTVYGLDGRRVRTLLAESRRAGHHRIVWDGTDDQGRQVASGTYIYRLVASSYTSTRKMILMK
jgi:hypothetical protein